MKDKSLDEIDQLFATQNRKGQTLKQQLLALKSKWETEARIDELLLTKTNRDPYLTSSDYIENRIKELGDK